MLHPNEIQLVELSDVHQSGIRPTSEGIDSVVEVQDLSAATGIPARRFHEALATQSARQRKELGLNG